MQHRDDAEVGDGAIGICSLAMNAVDVDRLLEVAWDYSQRALAPRRLSNRTRVGAAVWAENSQIFGGCNLQQRFHSHDVHAELNAISTMVAEGQQRLLAIAVVAEASDIAPCGSCLDWILQLGGDECLVIWQEPGADVKSRRAVELMPFHPDYELGPGPR